MVITIVYSGEVEPPFRPTYVQI